MKYLTGLLLLIVFTFIALPYVRLYQLDDALATNDMNTLNKLVDLESVRTTYKKSLEFKVGRVTGDVAAALPAANNGLVEFMRGGVKALGDKTLNDVLDMNWVRTKLHPQLANPSENNSIWQSMSFAFFESPTRFIVRIGDLGKNPIHLRMTLQDWYWRVTAIYD
ncbi:MAG: DUF2939 domain-containing protein [Thiotrichaceae bacterium]|nr:DUF2939 domain-containing protein [Thiotrichaceae bacterium]